MKQVLVAIFHIIGGVFTMSVGLAYAGCCTISRFSLGGKIIGDDQYFSILALPASQKSELSQKMGPLGDITFVWIPIVDINFSIPFFLGIPYTILSFFIGVVLVNIILRRFQRKVT
jgi:hypothetical protein